MIKLIEKQKIIISHFQKGKSQRQIAREIGLNRRTIAKYVKDYEGKKAKLIDSKGNSSKEELIADIVEDPGYNTSSRKKVKLTEEIIDRIKFYLTQLHHNPPKYSKNSLLRRHKPLQDKEIRIHI